MSKNRSARPRGSDSSDEALRGRNRELQKTIRHLHQRIRQLEKQLGSKLVIEKVKTPPTVICENCGKGEMKLFKLEKPGGALIFLICDICKHQRKK